MDSYPHRDFECLQFLDPMNLCAQGAEEEMLGLMAGKTNLGTMAECQRVKYGSTVWLKMILAVANNRLGWLKNLRGHNSRG